MKLNINNKTNLSLGVIGNVFDEYCKGTDNVTLYEGLVHYIVFEKDDVEYKMEITYKSTLLSLVVTELKVRSKEISTKDLKWPKLPKRKESKK